MRKLPYFMLFLVLAGCGKLERQHIPVFSGIRISDSLPADFEEEILEMKAMGINEWIISLPVAANPQDYYLPYVLPDSSRREDLSQVLRLMDKHEIPYSIYLSPDNFATLFPEPVIEPELRGWFSILGLSMVQLKQDIGGLAPKRILFGPDWPLMTAASQQDLEFFTGFLKSNFTAKEVIYVTELGKEADFQKWQVFDGIGLAFPPIPGEKYKAWSMEHNAAAGELALELKMPVFLAEANLIGEDPVLMLKNRMRFWPDSVQISGLHLNTLYPKTIFSDTSTYFGHGNNSGLRSYVKAYNEKE